MQYVAIKREEKNGKLYFVVSAIPLKNKNKAVVQKIPHPLGSDILMYENLEDAKDAITRAGFSFVLPNGEKGHAKPKNVVKPASSADYEDTVFNVLIEKVNSANSNVAASAILALSEFARIETFDILFNKIGEDNDLIRKNAIAGICRYSGILQDRIINSLKSSNWVERNSALTCIRNITDDGSIDIEKFLLPLTQICNDDNTIVQANALVTIAKVYAQYKQNKKI